MNTEKLLEERGSRYGDFAELAAANQNIQATLELLPNYHTAPAEMREAAHMICQKLCRAFNGDPYYQDNWHDIAGYAQLAEAACQKDIVNAEG